MAITIKKFGKLPKAIDALSNINSNIINLNNATDFSGTYIPNKLGIGTSTINNTLDVSGNVNILGDLVLNGVSVLQNNSNLSYSATFTYDAKSNPITCNRFGIYIPYANNNIFTLNWVFNNGIVNRPNISWGPVTKPMWVAVGTGPVGNPTSLNTIVYSYDGYIWSGCGNSPLIINEGRSVIWTGYKWLAVGACGSSPQSNWNLVHSYDGINWSGAPNCLKGTTNQPIGFLNTINGLYVYGQYSNSFGRLNSFNSSDPSFTNIVHPFGTNSNSAVRGAAENGNGTIVVVGLNNTGTNNNNTISYCTKYNTGAWTATSTSSTNNIFATQGNCVVWNGSIFVAGGSTTKIPIQYSPTGITWTAANITNSFMNPVNAIAWNGIMFVAVGGITTSLNTIAYSVDGINWTGCGRNTFTTCGYKVIWDGNKWMAVGQSLPASGVRTGDTIAYSNNGSSWSNSNDDLSIKFFTKGLGIACNNSRQYDLNSYTNIPNNNGIYNMTIDVPWYRNNWSNFNTPTTIEFLLDSYYNSDFNNITLNVTVK
jgi:hypothetical protein